MLGLANMSGTWDLSIETKFKTKATQNQGIMWVKSRICNQGIYIVVQV